jgi:hypothetical protein
MYQKLVITTLFTILTSLFLAWPVLACGVDFEPNPVKVGKDNTAMVKVIIKWEHRRCELDDDDVLLDLKGVKVLGQTGWKRIRHGLYYNTMKVELTHQTKGTLRVWRECSKKGISEGTVEVIR